MRNLGLTIKVRSKLEQKIRRNNNWIKNNKIYSAKNTAKVNLVAKGGDHPCTEGVYTYRSILKENDEPKIIFGSITGI